jgi:hypothetical protein
MIGITDAAIAWLRGEESDEVFVAGFESLFEMEVFLCVLF